MTEKKLRELLRKEIKTQLTEGPADFLKGISGTVRTALGSKKSQLAAGLDKVNTDRIAKLPADKKAEVIAALVAQVGLTKDDYDDIKMRIGRKLGVMSEGQKSNKQVLNEDAVTFLTQIGLPTIAKAMSYIGDGNFDAAANAFDTIISRPKEAAALGGALGGMIASGGALTNLAIRAVAFLKSKNKTGEIDITGDEEKQIDAMADKIGDTKMKQAMAEIKSYYNQKALLEAKRRNTAKRKK